MSIDATIWAWKAPVDSSTQRLVLLALADRAGEDHKAWPSAERLHQDTCLNIKTVPKILQELVKLGLIEDTKERKGSSNRVPVYRLIGVLDRVTGETTQKRDTPKNGRVGRTQKRNTPENGIHPKTGESDHQQASENTPENGGIQSPQNWDTPENGSHPKTDGDTPKNGWIDTPENGCQNLSYEPIKNLKRVSAHEIPDDFAISPETRQWAAANGVEQLEAHFESFCDKARSKNYKYADWDAAFREAIRKNWAGITQQVIPSESAMVANRPVRHVPTFEGLELIKFRELQAINRDITQAQIRDLAKLKNEDVLVLLNRLIKEQQTKGQGAV